MRVFRDARIRLSDAVQTNPEVISGQDILFAYLKYIFSFIAIRPRKTIVTPAVANNVAGACWILVMLQWVSFDFHALTVELHHVEWVCTDRWQRYI